MNEHLTIKEIIHNVKRYFYYLYLKWILPPHYDKKKDDNHIAFKINLYSCRHLCMFCEFKNECDSKSFFDYHN